MKDEKQTVIVNSISRSTRASNHVFLVIWNAFIETVLLTIVNELSLDVFDFNNDFIGTRGGVDETSCKSRYIGDR